MTNSIVTTQPIRIKVPPSLPAIPRPILDLASDPPALQDVISTAGDLPLSTSILGVYPDRGHPPTCVSPYCIDLTDPTPGSVLVVGDPGQAALLIRVMAESAGMIPPGQIEHVLLGDAGLKHYRREAHEQIMRLAAVAEQRRSGREMGPPVILAIPDLVALAGEYMDYGVAIHFKWLIENGPRSWVWTVAGIRMGDAHRVDRRILEQFGTLVRGVGDGGVSSPVYQADSGEWFVAPEMA